MRAEVSEYDKITECANRYLEGLKAGNVDMVKSAFHDNATLAGHHDGKVINLPIQALYDLIKKPSPEMKGRCDILSVEGDTAVAKILEDKEGGGNYYTDYFCFLKLNGEWKVISKTYNLVKRE